MTSSSSSRRNSANPGRPVGINDIDPLSQSRLVIDQSEAFPMNASGLFQNISGRPPQQQQQDGYPDESLPIFLPSLSMSSCVSQSLSSSMTSCMSHNDVINQSAAGAVTAAGRRRRQGGGILMGPSGGEHVIMNLPQMPICHQRGGMTSQMTSSNSSFLGDVEGRNGSKLDFNNFSKNSSSVNPIQENNRLCGDDVTGADVPSLNISSLSSILTSSAVSPHFPVTSSHPNSSVTFSDPKIGITANSACNSSSSSSAIASRNSNSQNLPNSHNSTGPGMIHNASSSNSSNLTSVVNNINNDNVNKNINNPESILSMNVNHFGQNNNNNSINNINFNNNTNNNNNNNDNNNNGQFNGSWNPIYNDQVFLPPLEKKVKKE